MVINAVLDDQVARQLGPTVEEYLGRGDLLQACAAKGVGYSCEATTVGVGQAQLSAPELGSEDTILCLQVCDNLLLVTLDPAGEHGEQRVEDHGLSSAV
jgi:hypothetical protein